MSKTLLGLVLAGSMIAVTYGAGCTDDGVPSFEDPGTGARDSGPPGDTFKPVGDDDASGGGSVDTACPAAAPNKAALDQPDGAPGWNPPKPRQTTACSTTDLQKFAANLANPALGKWDDLVTGLPASCSQCILSREADSTWQIIVADATGTNGFVNWGACYADAPHGSAACGQADQYLRFCVDISCAPCITKADFDACVGSKAVSDACDAAFAPALQSACPQAYAQELDDQCGTIVDAAAVVCGDGTLPDGGKLTD